MEKKNHKAAAPQTNPYAPNIVAYPMCGKCEAPYVLRRGFSLTTGESDWFWQRDCKHKKVAPSIRFESNDEPEASAAQPPPEASKP